MQKQKKQETNKKHFFICIFYHFCFFHGTFTNKTVFQQNFGENEELSLVYVYGVGREHCIQREQRVGQPHRSFPFGLVFSREGTSTAPIPWKIRIIVGNKVTSCAKKEKQKLCWLHHWRALGFSLSDMEKHERSLGRLQTRSKFLKCTPGWWVLIIIRQKCLSWSPARELSPGRWKWSLS